MAIPLYTVLPYCVILGWSADVAVNGNTPNIILGWSADVAVNRNTILFLVG